MIALDLIEHYNERIRPNGFKAQIVTVSRDAAITYKEKLDELHGPQSAVVFSATHGDEERVASHHRLDEIVRGKALWITERLRRFRELPPSPSEREFVSGETFLYLGRQARLIVTPVGERGSGVRLTAGRLIVPVAPELSGRARATAVRKQLIAWYRSHAARRLPEQVEPWRLRLGLAPAGVLIRSQEKRWASCATDGILRFNWRIIQAPVSLIDYVVAHELVHLLHRHHTPDFWSTLGRVLPDYEERRESLRRLGERLVW